jgi:formylglycine-generating enzyme required for sulfatase activity
VLLLGVLTFIFSLTACKTEHRSASVLDADTQQADSAVAEVLEDTHPDGVTACDDRECGYLENGASCGACSVQKAGMISTYCDDGAGFCQQLGPNCGNEWCVVPAGTFEGGRPTEGGVSSVDSYPTHDIVLTRSFLIQQTEVTQGQWMELMATNPSPFAACGLDCPVSGALTYFDVLEFANRLSERDGLPHCYDLKGCTTLPGADHGRECESTLAVGADCHGYRLPSENEWEHAARAGTPYCWPWGPIEDVAYDCIDYPEFSGLLWYCGNSAVTYDGCVDLSSQGPTAPTCAGVHPVATKSSNRLGLSDMNGNVYEFTATLWEDTSGVGVVVDGGYSPLIRNGDGVTIRGGSYGQVAGYTCSSFRTATAVGRVVNGDWTGLFGFRLVRTLE